MFSQSSGPAARQDLLRPGVPAMGWRLAAAAHGRGFATEAARAALAMAVEPFRRR